MKSKLSILFAALALVASMLACAGGELSLSNPRVATDKSGDTPVTTFAPTDTFYIVADLSNAPKGTTVEAKWYVVNVQGFDAGPINTDTPSVLNIEDNNFSGTVNFSLSGSTDGGWPVGDYKVELYLNGTLSQTVNFSVQ